MRELTQRVLPQLGAPSLAEAVNTVARIDAAARQEEQGDILQVRQSTTEVIHALS